MSKYGGIVSNQLPSYYSVTMAIEISKYHLEASLLEWGKLVTSITHHKDALFGSVQLQ